MPQTRGVAVGDSILAWNRSAGASVIDQIEQRTGLAFANLSVSGAQLGGTIPGQLPDGAFSWVVINGGANDLLRTCGCAGCEEVLDRLVSPDAQRGILPALARRATSQGARVVLLGYYDGNVTRNAFSGCQGELDELNRRMARIAASRRDVLFVDAGAVIDPADQSHWFIDHVHPSQKGSALIGDLIARAMAEAG